MVRVGDETQQVTEGQAGVGTAADKVVAILMVLAEEGRPLGINQIASLADIPQTTAHRLLGGLISAGWVEKEPDTATYRLGFGIVAPAAAALSEVAPFQQTQPLLQQINDRAGFAGARMSVRSGRYCIPVSPVGPRTAAHICAPGKVLLAAMPRDDLRRLYEGHALRRFTPNTITDLAVLEAELNEIRRTGYALDRGEAREYLREVAVPIYNGHGVIASLSFWGSAERMTTDYVSSLTEEMTIIAEGLSRLASHHVF